MYVSYGYIYFEKYPAYTTFLFPPRAFSRALWLRGTQGGRLYTTVQVFVPAGLRGACSGRSKSRDLASNHGIAFRRPRAYQAHGNPEKLCVFVCIFFSP